MRVAGSASLSISRSPGGWLLATDAFVLLMLLSARLPTQLVLLLLGLSMLVLALHHAFAGALYGVLLVCAVTLPLALWRDSPGFGELDVQRNQLDFTVVLLMLATLLVGRALGDLRQALARSAQMQQQLARANLAMEASPLGMTIAGARQADLPLVYCNAAFSQITGYSAEEALGRNCRFLLGDERTQPALQALRNAQRDGRSGHAIGNMQQLKAQGVRFAIDDFGAGYSSLTYLKRLPLDRLKVNRSFVADLDGAASGRMLVQTILMIARNLELECVAEGIEHDSQLAFLREQHCTLGQGYLFGQSMSERAFLTWLQARQR